MSNDNFLKSEHDFWDGIAQKWNPHEGRNNVVGWYDFHNQWSDYEDILFKDIVTKDKVALEYGCGPGRNTIKFADPKWGFRRIDGVDISQTNIDNARINVKDVLGDNLSMDVNFVVNDGKSIPAFDNTYDIVFSVICMQHIQSHMVRLEIMKEILRVLEPGGIFTAQMGFGPGHPRSIGYFEEPEFHTDKDVRIEKVEDLKNDLECAGFVGFDYVLRPPCKDEHPLWIWWKCYKPL